MVEAGRAGCSADSASDAPLARELILRACEVHGYAPGRGVHYFDGTLFEPGFTLEGAASYAIATERYIRETGDDQIVEEPILADMHRKARNYICIYIMGWNIYIISYMSQHIRNQMYRKIYRAILTGRIVLYYTYHYVSSLIYPQV